MSEKPNAANETLMASTSNLPDETAPPSYNWSVEPQGSYDAHSRARQELWRAPTGESQRTSAPQIALPRRSVDDEGWTRKFKLFNVLLSSFYAKLDTVEPSRGLMTLQNKSTPSLAAVQASPEQAPPIPDSAYDPSQLNFENLHVSDPLPRGSSAAGYRGDPSWVNINAQDPVARSGTSMSMGTPSAARVPRHAQTLPTTGWQPTTSWDQQGYYQPSDTQSVRSLDAQQYGAPGAYGASNTDQGYGGAYYDDGASMYSYDTNNSNAYYGQQQQQQYAGYDQYNQYNQADYGQQYQNYPQYPQHGGGEYADAGYGMQAGYDQRRPTMDRSQGTVSDMSSLKTQKFKAVDVSQPPYTREYIEQYRARIKGDPDPEAHFAYAKYLIDAAKKIGTKAADQRAVRKYRETLLAEALKTIRRLATQGDTYPEAQFFLASCCGSGLLGLQVDHERAYHLYLQAAKQNHPAASYRVAVCNELGVGTRKDPSRAFAFYRKAASLGDTAAMYKLGMILLSGSLGQPKNTRESIGWLKRAAEQADEENPHALHELGLLHEMPNSAVVVHDEAYAKDLFTKAAQLGFVASQYKLGFAYEYGLLGCPIDPKRSIAWYTKAAEKGDPEAELSLSGWYLTGSEGVLPQSDAEAYLWARRAANKGLSKAEFAVGYYAEQGIGVKQDVEFAKRWYMRAAGEWSRTLKDIDLLRLLVQLRETNEQWAVLRS